MSAAVLASLELPSTPTRPCMLSCTLGLLTGHLTAVIVVNHEVIGSAGGDAQLAESPSLGQVLQIGSARFRLLDEEVEPVRAFLAQFPSPASTSSDADYEATTTAVRSPSCGDGGTPPPRFSSFGGHSEASLDPDNRTLVHALTCGEDY